MKIKDKENVGKGSKAPMKEVLKNTVGNSNFRNVIILLSMWNIACCFTISFMGTKDVLYWIGYIYRYWHLYNDESSAKIYKQAPAETRKYISRNKVINRERRRLFSPE